MREIKFRAQEIDTGEWLHGGGVLLLDTGKCVLFHLDARGLPIVTLVKSETVGQYTGLKDKNRKEVYEGDILEAQLYKSTRRFVVEWTSIANHSSFGAGTHNIEVIGNIHENPELLENL